MALRFCKKPAPTADFNCHSPECENRDFAENLAIQLKNLRQLKKDLHKIGTGGGSPFVVRFYSLYGVFQRLHPSGSAGRTSAVTGASETVLFARFSNVLMDMWRRGRRGLFGSCKPRSGQRRQASVDKGRYSPSTNIAELVRLPHWHEHHRFCGLARNARNSAFCRRHARSLSILRRATLFGWLRSGGACAARPR